MNTGKKYRHPELEVVEFGSTINIVTGSTPLTAGNPLAAQSLDKSVTRSLFPEEPETY